MCGMVSRSLKSPGIYIYIYIYIKERQLKVESSFEWRMQQLDALRRMIAENEGEWGEALRKDLGHSTASSYLLEIAVKKKK